MTAPTDDRLVMDLFGREWPAMVTRPVSTEFDSNQQMREILDESPTGDSATQMVYGSCRTFCAHDTDTRGASIDDHGAWCKSLSVVHVAAVAVNGRPVTLYGELVAPYHHGTYNVADRTRNDLEYLELSLSGGGIEPDAADDCRKIYLTCGEVRRMAAALIHAADALDMLDRSFNDTLKARQERDD